jgi:ATP-dependent Lon protease
MVNELLNEQKSDLEIPKELPILIVNDLVIFPHMPPVPPFSPHHLALSGKTVTAAVDDAVINTSRKICVFKRLRETDTPTVEGFAPVGALIHIIKYRTDDDNVLILAQGLARVQIEEFIQSEPFFKVRAHIIEPDEKEDTTIEVEALKRTAIELFQRIVKLSSRYQEELGIIANNLDDLGRLADYITSVLDLKPDDKQLLLETIPIKDRLTRLIVVLTKELDLTELESKIQSDAEAVINKGQREYFLREQLKAIQTELGETDDLLLEVEEIREEIKAANMPEKARKVADKELKRLSKMHASSPESTVSRNYLDWLVNLPWAVSAEDELNISHAQQVLDEDHYDLEKVKDRILEYLAVRMLKQDMKGPILCFVGPPGVGKTSLGKSIARTMGRKFVRISLGGLHDEAEIRGHRRTYIGSMPGRIIKGLRQAESNNPVFMLDEIDKVGSDFRGDPAAALLEVLDPEQNNTFLDNYIDTPFDLSKVMFIATANQLHTILPPLRDRMEVLDLPGYTTNEKTGIAKQYLIPRQLEAHGISADLLSISDDATRTVIESHTREAGVRNLERELGAICRKTARKIAEGRTESTQVTSTEVSNYLGPIKFYSEVAELEEEVGVATGMSVTAYGGEILFVEATSMSGESKLHLTGHLSEVMQESAQAALSYVKSKADELGFNPDFFRKNDIHIHVPAGAIPKDGPSAGITIATALTSLATGQCVNPEVAMTGEITLRGRVLAIGGVKAKILAAKQAGIKTFIIPQRNEKDLAEIPDDAKEGLDFVFVDRVDQVFAKALSPRCSNKVAHTDIG